MRTPSSNSPQGKFRWRGLGTSLLRYWWLAAIAAALIAAASLYRSIADRPPVSLRTVRPTTIDLTPEEVRSIRDIGQWEFLSVSTEELIEWHRRRTFGSDHLARIYTGTLRIGIDMRRVSPDWLTVLPDSAVRLKLPPVELLDSSFIDEARTRSFYQKGTVPPDTLEVLYRRARNAMLRRCLTPQNMQAAEQNAREQIERLFSSLGFKKTDITFTPSHPHSAR